MDIIGSTGSGFSTLIVIVFAAASIAGYWATFAKAGKPGWGALIPFYNLYLLIKIAGRPGWWLVLCFIPLVNVIIVLIVSLDIAKNFGKGAGFGVLLWLFPMIMYLVLGFGSAQYAGAPAASAAPAAPAAPAAGPTQTESGGTGGSGDGMTAMTSSGPSHLPPITTTSAGQRIEAAPLVAPPSAGPVPPTSPRPRA